MKTIKFLFISLLLTAVLFFAAAAVAENYDISQWPAGFQVLFLGAVGVVDLLILKIYNQK